VPARFHADASANQPAAIGGGIRGCFCDRAHYAGIRAVRAACRARQGNAVEPIPIVLANDKIELTTLANGGRSPNSCCATDSLSALSAALGHFLALDGFGAPSPEEAALGKPFHGEAGRQIFKVIATHESGPVHSFIMRTTLPLAQEVFTRTIELVDVESVVRVTSDPESLLTVDRPISWVEHATLATPFMERGRVVVEMPATNCRVRPYKPGSIPGHLVYDKDFKSPMATTFDGRPSRPGRDPHRP
jgi:hypothetical protein